jgi:hypothetical protein
MIYEIAASGVWVNTKSLCMRMIQQNGPMNQGTYALALVQSLSDLDARAKQLAAKGFYDSWPEEYLKTLFKHRKDPRS